MAKIVYWTFIGKYCLGHTQQVVKHGDKFSKFSKLFVASWVIGKIISSGLSHGQKFFPTCWVNGKKCSTSTRNMFRKKLANFLKNFRWLSHICCSLSHQQKLFPVGWVIIINYLSYAQRLLKTSQKSRFYLWWLSLKLFPKDFVNFLHKMWTWISTLHTCPVPS